MSCLLLQFLDTQLTHVVNTPHQSRWGMMHNNAIISHLKKFSVSNPDFIIFIAWIKNVVLCRMSHLTHLSLLFEIALAICMIAIECNSTVGALTSSFCIKKFSLARAHWPATLNFLLHFPSLAFVLLSIFFSSLSTPQTCLLLLYQSVLR